MHRDLLRATLFSTALLLGASHSNAQSVLDLPRDSQQARLMQRVGLTDITVNYSRPLLHGNKLSANSLGGQVWRAGANENTTIEFTDPVSIEGKPLAKGFYGLFMIPGEQEWTVIFSKNATSWGAFTYDSSEDALRVMAKPQSAEFHEALTYDFDDLTPNSVTVTLRWERMAVPFKVTVNVNEIVQESLKRQVRAWSRWMWEGWNEAATYLLTNKLSPEDALEYADQSIAVEERFDNLVTKADALTALGRKDEEAAVRTKAMEMASATQIYYYGRQLQLQGQQEQAFEAFKNGLKRYPDHWVAHLETARLASAEGNFDIAAKEVKLAADGAPASVKPALEALVKRLEAKQDINK